MNPRDFQSRLFNASSDKKTTRYRFFLNSILLLLLFLQEKDKAAVYTVYHTK